MQRRLSLRKASKTFHLGEGPFHYGIRAPLTTRPLIHLGCPERMAQHHEIQSHTGTGSCIPIRIPTV